MKISRLYVTKIVSRAKVSALLMRASSAWAYSLSLPFCVSLLHTQTQKHTVGQQGYISKVKRQITQLLYEE